MSDLLQVPFTKSKNSHDWRHEGKEICYVVKNATCLVSLMRLNPETLQPIGVVLADEAEHLGNERWNITFRVRNALAIYSERELSYIKTFNAVGFDTGLLRVISVDECKAMEGQPIAIGSSSTTGDL
jgi:hypothetical protein